MIVQLIFSVKSLIPIFTLRWQVGMWHHKFGLLVAWIVVYCHLNSAWRAKDRPPHLSASQINSQLLSSKPILAIASFKLTVVIMVLEAWPCSRYLYTVSPPYLRVWLLDSGSDVPCIMTKSGWKGPKIRCVGENWLYCPYSIRRTAHWPCMMLISRGYAKWSQPCTHSSNQR